MSVHGKGKGHVEFREKRPTRFSSDSEDELLDETDGDFKDGLDDELGISEAEDIFEAEVSAAKTSGVGSVPTIDENVVDEGLESDISGAEDIFEAEEVSTAYTSEVGSEPALDEILVDERPDISKGKDTVESFQGRWFREQKQILERVCTGC